MTDFEGPGSGHIIQMDFDGSGNLIYFGRAKAGAPTSLGAWQIRRLTYSGTGNLLSALYANGAPVYNNVWDDRTSLSYS